MSIQASIQYPAVIDSKRVKCIHTLEIKSSPEKIFTMACPVEELRWIPDWEYEMVYSRSGVNEKNCIFREKMSGPVLLNLPITTTWITTLYDPDKYRIHFLINYNGKAVVKYEIELREVGPNISACTLSWVFTALDQDTNSMEEKTIKENIMKVIIFLSEALKYYCETGEMIKM